MNVLLLPMNKLLKRASAAASKVNSIFESNPMKMNAVTGFITFAGGDIVSRHVLSKDSNSSSSSDSVNSTTNSTMDNNIRTLLTGALGAFMNGFLLTPWYTTLDKIVGNNMNNKKQIFIKCLCDQFVYSPFAIVVFFGHSSFLRAWNNSKGNSNSNKGNSNSNQDNDIYNNDNNNKRPECSKIENSNKDNNINNNNNNSKLIDYAKADFITKMRLKFLDAYAADCCFWPMLNWINFRYLPLHFRPSFVAVAQFFWQAILSTINNNEKGNNNNINNDKGITNKSIITTVTSSSSSSS